MSTQSNKQSIQYKIDKNFAFNFDILQNIKVWKRKSSNWFLDQNKLMLSMRDWTSRLWNEISWSWWNSWMYFFTDFLWKRHTIRWYNNRVWRLDNINEWQDFTWNMSWNNFNFNTVKLPLMLDWSNPTEYTTPANATWSELVKKAAWDTWWAANIWRVIFITDNIWDTQVYRWCFWFISWYDTDTQEYIIWDSWILWTINAVWDLIGLKSWSKYKIFDTIWEFLQICNWATLERYYFWKSDWTLEEFTNYRWLATFWLRNIKAFSDTQFLRKQIYWNNSYYTFLKWTLYFSAWNVNNPFFHTFINSLTIPWIKWWDILDLFIFKNRLVIWWNNFISYINKFTDLIQVELLTNIYWMKENSLVDVWVDAYFLSTDRELYSLSETITWALKATNVTESVNNYVQKFNVNICTWFNWRQLFIYWEEDFNTPWVIAVLDIHYKFWSIYTWLTPSDIIVENWITYLADNNSDIIRYFDSTTNLDVWWIEIEQKVAYNELDLSDVFSQKTVSDLRFWLDNYTQELFVDIYMSWVARNTKKQRYVINKIEQDVEWWWESMWEWLMWDWILWWLWYTKEISFPYLHHIQLDSDSANIWKIILTWKDWSPFYLNEFVLEVWYNWQSKVYFSPSNTQ